MKIVWESDEKKNILSWLRSVFNLIPGEFMYKYWDIKVKITRICIIVFTILSVGFPELRFFSVVACGFAILLYFIDRINDKINNAKHSHHTENVWRISEQDIYEHSMKCKNYGEK